MCVGQIVFKWLLWKPHTSVPFTSCGVSWSCGHISLQGRWGLWSVSGSHVSRSNLVPLQRGVEFGVVDLRLP